MANFLPPIRSAHGAAFGFPRTPSACGCVTSAPATVAGTRATSLYPSRIPSLSMANRLSPTPPGGRTAAATATSTPSAATSGTASRAATFRAPAGVPARPRSPSILTSPASPPAPTPSPSPTPKASAKAPTSAPGTSPAICGRACPRRTGPCLTCRASRKAFPSAWRGPNAPLRIRRRCRRGG